MKKTVFTFCSIAVVCCAIFFACAKDDNSITHVGYVSRTSGGSSSGTGGNPNPNGVPSNSGYGTTTGTTAAATTTSGTTTAGTTTTGTTVTSPYGSISYNSSTVGFVSSTACGSATMSGTSSAPVNTLNITFANPPAVGNYNIISFSPTNSTDVSVAYDGTFAVSGTVVVTSSGGKFTATFTNVSFGTFTASGSLTCM
jgi:hypothetical protein